jgi:hypothetical protein
MEAFDDIAPCEDFSMSSYTDGGCYYQRRVQPCIQNVSHFLISHVNILKDHQAAIQIAVHVFFPLHGGS